MPQSSGESVSPRCGCSPPLVPNGHFCGSHGREDIVQIGSLAEFRIPAETEEFSAHSHMNRGIIGYRWPLNASVHGIRQLLTDRIT